MRPPDVLKRARRAVARAEQQRVAAAQRAADRAMLPAARPEVTLRDYGATRLVPAMRGLAEGKPAEQYRAGWRQRVLPALGDRPVRAIDTHAVAQAVQSWTAGERSRATIMATRSVLARVLDEAVADGLLARNPAREPTREDLRQVDQFDPPAPQRGLGARWAVARVGQLRAADERRTEERVRAEQLARWHADDQTTQDGDNRDLDSRAVSAVRDSGAGLGGQS